MKVFKNSILKSTFLNNAFGDGNSLLYRFLTSTQAQRENSVLLTSKKIRSLFLNYFIKDKNHTYVQSSPVFLNNDPSLLFVNAGMNQFRSLILNKTHSGEALHGLKSAANSQKCIRLSGKHNDLQDVGIDLYHHTFFEMLGNWSFGDYSKAEACKMAWNLLTNVYGLNPEQLYVTYFGGSDISNLKPDEDCKKIWLDIGIHPDHIFPFGTKENFWEMGDKGPCGPCTEIHYDFLNSGPHAVSQKINADNPDIIELWNLVFIQYNREQNGVLHAIPILNIDTGMGFERLCSVLQGKRSNYDTDLFVPIFKEIEKNFKVRPYLGRTGDADTDQLDTAYRIIADHARMFCVSISDGLFPDSCDAGHVLRKIIKRAVYAANCSMKTPPGVLSSLVPCVAETLDFYPELTKHVNEITYIVNDEEKMFHQVINKGRKARNRMMSESNDNILDGQKTWELHIVHGLEENVVQDLASEVDLSVDWDGYAKFKSEKEKVMSKKHEEKANFILEMVNLLRVNNVPATNDSFKYDYITNQISYGVESIWTSILAVFKQEKLVTEVEIGDKCIVVSKDSNFYSEAGGQISDIGTICNKDFTFKVEKVSPASGYVFHHGTVSSGTLICPSEVEMNVDKDHRLSCSQNHTATHILNSALRKILPYTTQRSSYVGPDYLKLHFSAKSVLEVDQLDKIQNYANTIISKRFDVTREEMAFDELLSKPNAILLRGEEYPDKVSVITIGQEGLSSISIEPCCGTHVHNTHDIERLILLPSKSSYSGTTKVICAVTGKSAEFVEKNTTKLEAEIMSLKATVETMMGNIQVSLDAYKDIFKNVKKVLRETQMKTDISLLGLKNFENILLDLRLKLSDIIENYSASEAVMDLSSRNSFKSLTSQSTFDYLKTKGVPTTVDSFKYNVSDEGVEPIRAKVLAVIGEMSLSNSVRRGLNCRIILDNTNFYALDDDQNGDEGIIFSKDFTVKVSRVYKEDGYVFHEGFVEEGVAVSGAEVELSVNQARRLACSQNHTSLHLVNTALQKVLPYYFPRHSDAGGNRLIHSFTSKNAITNTHLEDVENFVNDCIAQNYNVCKQNVPMDLCKDIPTYKSKLIQKLKESVPIVEIQSANEIISKEPCCGTHVSKTGNIGSFIIVSLNSTANKVKILQAVTGSEAEVVKSEGEAYNNSVVELEEYVIGCLNKSQLDNLELWDCLKEVKLAKGYHETVLPLLLFRKHKDKLSELSKLLENATDTFVQDGYKQIKSEMETVLTEFEDKDYIVHTIESLGDAKKIVNYAMEKSIGKPSLYFARDGRKSIVCSCSVPKEHVHSRFSALMWIDPVASHLHASARSLTKDPELFYSVVSDKVDVIDRASQIAHMFAKENLK